MLYIYSCFSPLRGLSQEYGIYRDKQQQHQLSEINGLKGFYFGDCIIKKGLGILGEMKN